MANIKIGKDIQQSRLTVAFPYDTKFVIKVKSIEGHRWHPNKKEWSFPYSEDLLKRILLFFKNENIHLDSNLQVSFEQKSGKQIPN